MDTWHTSNLCLVHQPSYTSTTWCRYHGQISNYMLIYFDIDTVHIARWTCFVKAYLLSDDSWLSFATNDAKLLASASSNKLPFLDCFVNADHISQSMCNYLFMISVSTSYYGIIFSEKSTLFHVGSTSVESIISKHVKFMRWSYIYSCLH